MNIGKDELLQLYSIALEESRHHARLFTQTWISTLVFITGIATVGFFACMYLFDFVVPLHFRLFMITVGLVVAHFFLWPLLQHALHAEECLKITNRIEAILKGETDEKTGSIGDLLLGEKLRRRSLWELARWACTNQRGTLARFYVVVTAWIYVWLFVL